MPRFLSAYAVFVFCLLSLPAWGRNSSPRVLVVAAEQAGVFQTGGLAHATHGLAVALNESGVTADFLMPAFVEMQNLHALKAEGEHFIVPLDWRDGHPHKFSTFDLYSNIEPHLTTYFLKHVSDSNDRNYFDNRLRPGQTRRHYGPDGLIGEVFGAFSKAAADFILDNHYDVVILNDWMTGLIAPDLRDAEAVGKKVPKIIFAVHNLAFQGIFPKSLVDYLGMPDSHFQIDGYEFYDQVNFLKAGLQYSDFAYTVSPQYLREIATARFGMGLDGLIRHLMQQHRMAGILNGIDERAWAPDRIGDGALPLPFSRHDLNGKIEGKKLLQEKFGLPVSPNTPVFVFTSRLSEQKGLKYLLPAFEKALRQNAMQLILIGDGDSADVDDVRNLQTRHPQQVRYMPFSSEAEHWAIAYGDFFINGAWFEPSGLNQLFALANGTVPIVSRVGGLSSSIKDGKNGITFAIAEDASGHHYDTAATTKNVVAAIKRATHMYAENPKQLNEIRRRGMSEDHSWRSRVQQEFLPMLHYVLNDGPRRLADEVRTRQEAVRPSELAHFSGITCEQYLESNSR